MTDDALFDLELTIDIPPQDAVSMVRAAGSVIRVKVVSGHGAVRPIENPVNVVGFPRNP